MREGTVTFNFVDAAGRVVDWGLVAIESAAARISLRTGCFCNLGISEAALGLESRALRKLLKARDLSRGLDDIVELLGLPSPGAVRVSFGLASTVTDLDRFFGFVEKAYKDRIIESARLGSGK